MPRALAGMPVNRRNNRDINIGTVTIQIHDTAEITVRLPRPDIIT
jgi:hypothetical protein